MPSAVSPDAELGLNLALAVVSSSHAPVLLLDENRAVIVASDAFCT
ncbi:histidine kinase, partial [Escherichia coli]